MALNFVIPASLKRGAYPRFLSNHSIFKMGVAMEFIKRFKSATHATAVAQWAADEHKPWVCVWEDKNAPGGPIVERRRLNHPSDATRGCKFAGIYPKRYTRTLDMYTKGLMTTRIEEMMAVPVILGTWEEHVDGHVTEVFDDKMTVFAQEKVIRPYPKNKLSWELDFIDDGHIIRDFAVVGEPATFTHVNVSKNHILRRIKQYHPTLPVIFITGASKPMTMSFATKLCPYSAECDLNMYSYIFFRIIEEDYWANEDRLKGLAMDNKIHTIEVDSEWLWTVDMKKLLSMPISRSFERRRPDLHLRPEFKEKFPELSVEPTYRMAI